MTKYNIVSTFQSDLFLLIPGEKTEKKKKKKERKKEKKKERRV